MRLHVEMNLDNDAFQGRAGYEIGLILSHVNESLHFVNYLTAGDGATLLDSNGNTVGFWRVAD